MRYRLPALALIVLGSTTTWLPGVAAAHAPPAPTAGPIAAEFRMSVETVSVKGRLLCNGQPSTGDQSRVKLLNKRIGFDDSADRAPAADGTFKMTLTTNHSGSMDPRLDIYTTCNYANLYGSSDRPCQRQFSLPVPSKYVEPGTATSTTYDVGTLKLEAKRTDEEVLC